MGCNLLQVLPLDWQEIFHLESANNSAHTLHRVLEKYPDVFKEGLGTLKGFEAKILVDSSAHLSIVSPDLFHIFYERSSRKSWTA